MNFVFRADIALRALDKFLEANAVDKNAKYSEDVLVVDMASGYRETLLRLPVKPNFVILDHFMVELLSDYLEEV